MITARGATRIDGLGLTGALFMFAAVCAIAGGLSLPELQLLLLPIGLGAAILAVMLSGAWLLTVDGRTCALLAVVCIALIDLRVPGPASGAVSLALKASGYCLLLVLGVRSLARQRGEGLDGLAACYLAYAALAWSSIVYSADPMTTAYTGIALVAVAMIAVIVAQLERVDAERIVGYLSVVLGASFGAAAIVHVLDPALLLAHEVAGEGRISGLHGSPNSLGFVAALAVLASCAAIGRERFRVVPQWAHVACLALALGAIWLSGSRTSLIALLVSAWVYLSFMHRRIGATLLLVGLLGFGGVLLLGEGNAIGDWVVGKLSRVGHGADVRNFTGRLEIWDYSASAWLAEPVFGYGLGASRDLIREGWATSAGMGTTTAHNGLLESLLNVGVAGTAFLVCILLALCVRLLRALRNRASGPDPLAAMCWCLFMLILLQSLMEKSFAGTASTATGVLSIAIGMSHHLSRRD